MPRRFPQSFRVFPLDVTKTTQIEVVDLSPESGRPWTHTTILPGGFGHLQISFPEMSRAEYWEWRLNRLFARFRIEDSSQKVVWEGREEVPRAVQFNWNNVKASLLFRGYWSNLLDDIDTTNHSAEGGAIVQALINNLDADTIQLSTDFGEVETWGSGTVVLSRDGLDLTPWDTLIAGDGLLAHEDGGGLRYDFSVYEDRKARYKARNPSALNWQSYISDGSVLNFPDEVRGRDIQNAVNARDSAGLGGAFSEDAASIAKYLRRAVIIQAPDSTSKTQLIAKTLAERKDPRQRLQTMRLKRIYDNGGIEQPLCHVRAGEVLRVPDALTLTADVDAVTLNAITTFFVVGTECRHSGDDIELTIRVDNSARTLANLLKENGVIPK